jgi:hypothetical protein
MGHQMQMVNLEEYLDQQQGIRQDQEEMRLQKQQAKNEDSNS